MISRLVSFVVKETFGKISTSVSSVTVSYLIRYDKLLRNATAILLQNETEVYYKMRQFYYKMQVITNCDNFITKCEYFFFFKKVFNQSIINGERHEEAKKFEKSKYVAEKSKDMRVQVEL